MIITLVLFILSFIICTAFIHSKWKFYTSGSLSIFLPINRLRSYNTLSRIWPCDDGFLSLIFSFQSLLDPLVTAEKKKLIRRLIAISTLL